MKKNQEKLFRPPPDEIIKTRTAQAWVDKDGMINIRSNAGFLHSLADATENIKALYPLSLDLKRPAMIDISDIKGMSREARSLYSGKESDKLFSAIALIVTSPISLVVGNFFLGINKPSIPIRIFSDKKKATRWLNKFLVD